MRRCSPQLFIFLLFATSPLCAQEKVIQVDPCELSKNAAEYNRKLVRVSAKISLAFEDFSLNVDCGQSPGTWLIFGGDVPTPTSSTFNDVSRKPKTAIKIENIAIPLTRNAAFQLFHDRLTARRESNPDGSLCNNCYFYDVSATVTGRFFAGYLNGPLRGYGHLGCCSLLAIQEVTNVSYARTAQKPDGNFVCSENAWKWKEDRPAAIALQKFVNDGHQPWRVDDTKAIAENAFEERRKEWQETSSGRIVKTEELLRLDDRWYGGAEWVSYDGLTTYGVNLQKPGWLRRTAKKMEWAIWIPYSVYRWQCVSSTDSLSAKSAK